MGSGEGDAIRDITITDKTPPVVNNTSWSTYDTWPTTTTTNTMYYTYTNNVYLYQIKCSKRGCKTFNWLELNKVTPCVACGSKLRAIAAEDIADFETVVDKKR